MAQCHARGVDVPFRHLGGGGRRSCGESGCRIVATGGLPHTEILEAGNELVVSAWDILSGDTNPAANVLLFDDAGDHAALQAAEMIAATGAKLEDHDAGPDLRARSDGDESRALHAQPAKAGRDFHRDVSPTSGEARGGTLVATIGSDYVGVRKERRVEQSSSTTARCQSTSFISPSSRGR